MFVEVVDLRRITGASCVDHSPYLDVDERVGDLATGQQAQVLDEAAQALKHQNADAGVPGANRQVAIVVNPVGRKEGGEPGVYRGANFSGD